MKHITVRFQVPVAWTHREEVRTEHPGGGHTITRNTVVDQHTEETVLVEVDLYRLAQALGSRAVHSKGGKAVEAGGLVVVRHLKTRR